MERIKEALERAKSQRQSKPAGDAPAREPSTPVRNLLPDVIDYTDTHVFKPDPNLLKLNRVIVGGASDPGGDAFRMLRTRVLQAMADNGWNSIAVSSPSVGNGKSVTAANLAISLAREVNHTVLLVDLDLRQPSIHHLFGYQPKQGVGDHLARGEPIAPMLFNPSIERLVVLPGLDRYDQSSELLSSPRMQSLSEELRRRYPERIVVFDLPPVLAVDDALAFSPYVESMLLVVEDGVTQAQELQDALEILQDANVIGTVLNKSHAAHNSYYRY